MTVEELIEKLKKMPPDAIVTICADGCTNEAIGVRLEDEQRLVKPSHDPLVPDQWEKTGRKQIVIE